jgi:antitoxin PrlF
MLATVTTKGQVTIPKDIRDRLGIQPNDRIDFVLEGDWAILLPVKALKDLRGVVPARSGSSIEDERRKAKQVIAKRVQGGIR